MIMVNDVSRAFFHAPATRLMYVEVPEEDRDYPGQVARLNMSLYGTRDASLNWQTEVARHLTSLGFYRSSPFPSMFVHSAGDLITIVHGDDYMTVGTMEGCNWLRGKLEGRFDMKTKFVGHQPQCQKEVKILDRVIRATEEGYEYEADQRHGEIIVAEIGLASARGVKTPVGTTEEEHGMGQDVGQLLAPRRQASIELLQ